MKIIFVGDIALNGLISSHPSLVTKRFKGLSEIVQNNYQIFANFEIPVRAGGERNENKNLVYHCDYEVAKQVLKSLNVTCVSLANNHIYDWKMPGLKVTIGLLEELDIHHTGAGWKPEHIEPAVLNLNGIKITFMAYLAPKTNPKTEFCPELLANYFEESKVINDIKVIRPVTDKIICSIHWGNDYSRFFTASQQTVGRRLIDAGADIIMGHHPHTYQPFEIYHGGIIFYSLGQLCFGDSTWLGELRALKRKTKKSYLPILDEQLVVQEYVKTKERKGNYIKIYRKNHFEVYNKFLYRINQLKNRNKLLGILINLKENGFDRIIEYFFGYYRNPIKQIFSIFKNWHKIEFMKRDVKKRMMPDEQ